MKTTLAYIDDSLHNLECIGMILSSEYEVEPFLDPENFLNKFDHSSYTAILVDIHMPKMNGFSLYENILENNHYNGCPIFFISSDDTDENRIKSFSLGAVDFLNREMNSQEMLARISSKILFYKKHRSIIEFENLKLNLTLLKAFLNNEELRLTFIEFKLLTHFLQSYPVCTSKEELSEKVWSHKNVLDATIHTHIFNLNSKLKNWDHEICAERGVGLVLTKKKDSDIQK